ncbi:MAG: SMP-30/gluconolactonase/LRE family protein [Cypionkella sp.]
MPRIYVERLWSGAAGPKGQHGLPQRRYLVRADIPNNRMLLWDETDGSVSVFRTPSNNANGYAVDRLGRLPTCEHLTRRVARTEHDGRVLVLADRFEGQRFDFPNDIFRASDGSIWFMDVTYGILADYEGERSNPEMGGERVYRIDGATGALTRVVDDFAQPNGLAFSPDEGLLYLSDTGAMHLLDGLGRIQRFRVCEGGRLSGGEVFGTCTAGLFDGFRLDRDGRIWLSALDGVHCIAPNGTLFGKIHIAEIKGEFVFGGGRVEPAVHLWHHLV